MMTMVARARRLRRNTTDAERALWRVLSRGQLDGQRFRRQHPVGRYVVDFACVPAKLVVEVNGGQHDEQRDADEARDSWLRTRGYRVLRFWNHDVLRAPRVVAEEIQRVLRERLDP